MADRYNRIFNLQSNLFKDDSPVLIKAGAVLSDNNTGRLLLQLKLGNVEHKRISAVFVNVKCNNVANEDIKGIENFQYLDLRVERNQTFGEKSPIILPDNTTRSITVSITKVVFSDDHIWINDGVEPFKPLPELIDINRIGTELIAQLDREKKKQNKNHVRFVNLPLELENYWFCACRALNRNSEIRVPFVNIRKSGFSSIPLRKYYNPCLIHI